MAVLGLAERNLVVVLRITNSVSMRFHHFLYKFHGDFGGGFPAHAIFLLAILLSFQLKRVGVVKTCPIVRLLLLTSGLICDADTTRKAESHFFFR